MYRRSKRIKPSLKNLSDLHLTTTHRSQEGGSPEGQKEETNSHSLKSDPVKSEGKEHNINTLEQELDCLKHIVAQQNQVLQQLGAHLQTPPRQVTTTKTHDIPVLE